MLCLTIHTVYPVSQSPHTKPTLGSRLTSFSFLPQSWLCGPTLLVSIFLLFLVLYSLSYKSSAFCPILKFSKWRLYEVLNKVCIIYIVFFNHLFLALPKSREGRGRSIDYFAVQCASRVSSSTVIKEPDENAEFQTPPQIYWITIFHLTRLPRCYGLSAMSSQNSYIEILTPNGVFGRSLCDESGALMNGTNVLIKETPPESSLAT